MEMVSIIYLSIKLSNRTWYFNKLIKKSKFLFSAFIDLLTCRFERSLIVLNEIKKGWKRWECEC